ncbi:MAG: response regulator transcription factor [Chloroflexi bacterium]|nr:response regulator transcription factor [Chloroflexota bacterium]MCI0576486.1 response regulator transcription factor [Chloroflexota bacterium]MCI0729386.1 response regulator transcription factor [Chloroflexota bacterium]
MTESEEILVVDDEASVVEVVSLYLRREGFQVRTARDGRQALAAIHERLPALVVLDLMLPKVDGLEIMRRLRDDPATNVPVIMLTARSQETDRIYGLELGADDYVVKPFSPAELVARVKTVLRRSRGPAGLQQEGRPIKYDDLVIDPLTRLVHVRGQEVELTATEFNLLWFMASHPRQVFSRDRLLENVWGFSDYVDPSTVTVHIRRLREKIEVNPSQPQRLLTVWGVGYKFEPGMEA